MHPFHLADQLRVMESSTGDPSDLPGRYGRVIRVLERLLTAADTSAVVAGGWAVWHHGYAGRVTQDVDIVVAREKVDTLQQRAELCGFDVLQRPASRWPQLQHRETGIEVDFLPEGELPGTPTRPGLVPIGHPQRYKFAGKLLPYITLEGLIELKLGAGRAKDIADLIELIKQHPSSLDSTTSHLQQLHPTYAATFQQLIHQAAQE